MYAVNSWTFLITLDSDGNGCVPPGQTLPGFSMSNNLFYHAGRSDIFWWDESRISYATWAGYSGAAHTTGNVTSDPQFTAPYNLLPSGIQFPSTSPAKDAGADMSSFGVLVDLFGTVRPQFSRYDIGAYEYSGANAGVGGLCYPR